jgi:flagellar biosynthetic protein FliR
MNIAIYSGDVVQQVQALLWPLLRLTGLFLVAPLFSAALIPTRVKIILALTLSFIIAPLAGPAAPLEALSAGMMLTAINQVLIGIAMGLVLQVVFEALTFAGQTIAMTMGLGYATLIDPLRGASVPVVSQFMLVLGILLFLSLDGHLAVIRMLAESFQWLPVSAGGVTRDGAYELVMWGGELFARGLMIALPALIALIIVNMAMGVVSRAAPTLNLFAIGFPVTLAVGFLMLILSLYNLQNHFTEMLGQSLQVIRSILGPGV